MPKPDSSTVSMRGRLDSSRAVLCLIDYLTELMLGCGSLDQLVLRNNVVMLMKLGRIFELPTLITGDEGRPLGPFMAELQEYAPDGQYLARNTVSCFDTPAFRAAIERTGRRQLILAGISTDLCLMLTAIPAVQAGYEVFAVLDASATWNPTVEAAAVARLTQAGVIVTNVVALAGELQADWTRPTGPAVQALLAEHHGPSAAMANNFKITVAAQKSKPKAAASQQAATVSRRKKR